MAKLGEVCDILNGYAFKSNQYTTSGVRIIRISNVQKGYIEDKSPVYYPCDDENVKKYELKQNDLLISLTGNVGRTALLEEKFLPAALNQRVSCVRLKEPDKVLKTYLFHLLNSDYFEQQCMKAAEGVAQKNLSPKWLFEYKIPIYSIERQKEISNTLDKIDLLIILRKQQLAKLDELVKARFVEMFGDVLLNSMQWPEKTLENMADIVSGITKGRKTAEADLQEVPYMAVSNVKDGYIDWTTVKTILATRQEIEQYRLMPDDILMTEGGDPDKVGRGAIIKVPLKNSIHQNHIFRVRLDEQEILPSFFAEYLRHQKAKRYFLGCAKQTTGIASINMRQLRALPTLVPPLSLQKQFAAFVERVDRQKQTIQQSLEKLELMKKALMQEYFG
jgi:type I restriction enzyme S subunit